MNRYATSRNTCSRLDVHLIGSQLTLATLAVLILLGTRANALAESEPLAQLEWHNGDLLPGRLVKADETNLWWSSPRFGSTFVLDRTVLHKIRFPKNKPPSNTKGDFRVDDFRVLMKTGDILYGSLRTISKDEIVLQTVCHGEVRLVRKEVRSLFRVANPALLFDGPGDLSGWSAVSPAGSLHGENEPAWNRNDSGLTTNKSGAALFMPLQLPPKCEVQMVLSWKKTANFSTTLMISGRKQAGNTALPFHLITWDDELVLETSDDYEAIQTIKKTDRRIALRLFWDRPAGRLAICTIHGRPLTVCSVPKDLKRHELGFYLANQGEDLTIERIQVGHWSGQLPEETDLGASRLHLVDGEIVYGQLESFDVAKNEIRIAGSSAETNHRIDQISTIHFGESRSGAENVRESDGEYARLTYHDGASLHGRLLSIQDQALLLQTDFSDAPIACRLAGARMLRFPETSISFPETSVKPKQAPSFDLMEFDGGKLHGKVDTLAPPESPLAWKPVGSKNCSSFAMPCKVTLAQAPHSTTLPTTLPSSAEGFPDLLYLTNRDILPCRALSADEEFLSVHLAVGDAKQIPHSHIQALKLGALLRTNTKTTDFGGKPWFQMADNPQAISRNASRVTFHEEATLGNKTILNGDEVQFDLQWGPPSAFQLRLNLFTQDEPFANSSAGIEILLWHKDHHLFIHGEKNGAIVGHGQMRLHKNRVRVHIVMQQENAVVFVNKTRVMECPIQSNKKRGKGILIKYAGGGAKMTLSNFRVGSAGIGDHSPKISETERRTLLTVPRWLRKRRPTHVLVANNGDLLRGHLKKLDTKNVHFVSRREEVTLPRQRLASILWLHDDDQQGVLPNDPRRVQALFDKMAITFVPEKMEGDWLLGTSPLVGKCRIPRRQIETLYSNGYTDPNKQFVFATWKLRDAIPPKHEAVTSNQGNGGKQATDAPLPGADHPLVGTKIDTLQAPMVGGGSFDLTKHQGKVVVLDFWATWCGPCVHSLPNLIKTVDSLDSDTVQLFGVNVGENATTVEEFLHQRKWHLLVLLDPKGTISKQFKVDGIPQTVVIGRDGKVKRVYIGSLDSATEQNLKQLLEELSLKNS